MNENIEQLKYPIGKFKFPQTVTEDEANQWIAEIENIPELLIKIITPLNDDQLDTCYREGGWTIRQVVHHLADSHINSYVRFKLTLTEDTPTIKAYFEDRWAELPDSTLVPVKISLNLLKALHTRWVALLKVLSWEDLQREFYHPEADQTIQLAQNLALYAWHGKHHLAHIQSVITTKGL